MVAQYEPAGVLVVQLVETPELHSKMHFNQGLACYTH